VHAQIAYENTYQSKMKLMDSLSIYNMKNYDTLYHVLVSDTSYGNAFKIDHYGWIMKRNRGSILFINTNGTESEILTTHIVNLHFIPVIDTTIDGFNSRAKNEFPAGNFGKNYLLSLWLYEKGKYEYSKQLLPQNERYFSDSDLKNDFGIIYYDAMLWAFTGERNYTRAIEFGNHLSENIFKDYQYQKNAITLTQQLKSHPDDYKAFRIPDSLEWVAMKNKLSRNDQVIYLAERLRLLNCIQPGQPAFIGYDMYQFSISDKIARKLNISYWNYNPQYVVINPFAELLKMKLSPRETELLLPYLLSDDYIASYSYHRDFFPERTLHKVSWVVNNLIFEVTNQHFFNQSVFDSMDISQKKVEIEKIKRWCDENSGLTQEEITIKELNTVNKWNDFHKSLITARRQNYSALLPIIVERFNDFPGGFWPSNKGIMAEMMFELGNEKYIGTVKKWSTDTTDMWVNLFSSLYLLKNDKNSYDAAMNKLQSVLKQCDGTAYYPHAMDLLLSMNDKKALKLAEGILDKPQFPQFIDWDYYLNFVKKLLLLKSDYTFNFINDKLGNFTPQDIEQFKQNNGKMNNILVQGDFYVLAVDKLKSVKTGYDTQADMEARLKYRKELSKWFSAQYALLREGKPNELLLNIVPVNAPVSFIDAAR